ncbi:MAG: AAA family ATPase [bacterium]|nr:AAA family ATPase [bacterium]
MQIKRIYIDNIKSIQKQSIELLPNINVFVGVNGSGKSTILNSIAISLSWLINRIQRENTSGKPIDELDIKYGTETAILKIEIENNRERYNWSLVKTLRGYSSEEKSQLTEVSKLASLFQIQYQKNNQLPMIVYYPVNRVAEGIRPSFKTRETISELDVYDNALGGKANFQSFFEWFRIQDDIVNEQSQSRSRWMHQHRAWIQKRISNIFSIFSFSEQNDGFNHFKKILKHDEFIVEEPKYLFRELIQAIEHLDFENVNNMKVPHILQDIEYLLYQMGKLSESNKDNAIGFEEFPFHHLERVIKQIVDLVQEESIYHSAMYRKTVNFIWEMFLFSILLGFWWLSDSGKKNIEQLFKLFHPLKNLDNDFFRNMTDNFIKRLMYIIERDTVRLKNATSHQGRELQFVTKAIESFIPEYSNFRVKRVPTPHMLVDKVGITIRLDRLSDGEKNMIAMIGDIARRLSMSNPSMKNPLKGDGIVLIDEIDLHLHPAWQRIIISQLTEVFSNCQFIVTTHSPQILSHVKAEHVFLLKQENDNLSVIKPTESYGKSSDSLLEDILGVESRPLLIKKELHQLFKLIQEQNLEKAKKLMHKLENEIEGREPELVKANVLIQRKEILGK